MESRDVDINEGDLAICVFDVDENPPERIVQAMDLAAKKGILISLTNPCYEVWLALHYQDVPSPVSRKEAYDLIVKHYPMYTKTGDLGPVLTLRNEAIRRASAILDRAGITDPKDIMGLNPSSTLHFALEAIEALKERNRSRRRGCR